MIRRILLYFLIFLATFLVYLKTYPEPRTWYDHYLHQAKSFATGRVDVPSMPEYYQDTIKVNGKIYTPFPPMPAVVLIPIVKYFPDITQQNVSIIISSLNAVILFILLSRFTNAKNSLLLTGFFAFGTVAFWSAVVGTTWYFAHNTAVFFLLVSLLAHTKKQDFLSGVLFAFAALSRYTILFGGVFFLFELFKHKRRLILFLAGAFIFLPIQFYYDYIRFGHILETGYLTVYGGYVNASFASNIRQLISPQAPPFGYIDPRNIPLHLFTFLAFPPLVSEFLKISPSPFGMGVLFTSPLILLALKPDLKNSLQRNLFIGALFIAIMDFMHYAQGWVQFGYRFFLDFAPFLFIILALKFKPRLPEIVLLAISIIVSTWGTLQAIKLGW